MIVTQNIPSKKKKNETLNDRFFFFAVVLDHRLIIMFNFQFLWSIGILDLAANQTEIRLSIL